MMTCLVGTSLPEPPEYISNLRRWEPYLRICRVSWDFTVRRLASFRGADQRLPEQRRNRLRRAWSG
jgi:hypothetical protein